MYSVTSDQSADQPPPPARPGRMGALKRQKLKQIVSKRR